MKNRALKTISVFLILAVFAGMAMASSSSGSSSKISTKITADNDSGDDASSDEDKASADDVSDVTENKGEMNYEITDTHFDHHKNIIDDEVYFGYVEITNTGSTNIYLEEATFDLEDDSGHLLQSDNGYGCPAVVAPGEKGYFYASDKFDSGVDLKNGVNLVPTVKIKEAVGELIVYEVTDTDLTKDKTGPRITGRIVNNTDATASGILLHVYMYDKNGKIIAMYSTSFYDELEAGGKMSFDRTMSFLYADIEFEDISDYKAFAVSDYYQF